MERPGWVPDGIDVDKPNAARMYDFALGGCHNFAVDRELVEQAEARIPGASRVAHANRAFLGRVVRWLVAAGVRQFLDIGSGIPTLGNVHEIAQSAATGSRVMYVDVDPVAVAHSQSILVGNPGADAIEGDLRRPDEIVRHPEILTALNFSEPVAVLLIAVLHFVPDEDDPAAIVGRLRDALAPGSYIAISHGSPPALRGEDAETVRRLYQRTATPLHLRTPEQILGLMDGLDLVDPGLVPVTEWAATSAEPRAELLGAVGRKPRR